jgi:hypothetical protein
VRLAVSCNPVYRTRLEKAMENRYGFGKTVDIDFDAALKKVA